MTTEFPIYNYVAATQEGGYTAEVQSASGKVLQRHFDTRGRATAWARRRAAEMLPRERWEPDFFPMAPLPEEGTPADWRRWFVDADITVD